MFIKHEAEALEIIDYMLENKVSTRMAAESLGTTYDIARNRVRKYSQQHPECKAKLKELYKNMERKKHKWSALTPKGYKVIKYFEDKDNITNLQILDYSMKINSSTAVAEVVKALEKQGKKVARL